MGQRDRLGAVVALGAIAGAFGLSLIIGPGLGAAVEPASTPTTVESVAPPTSAVPAPEPTEPTEPLVPARVVPLHVRIGTIAVDAPIVPVGLEDDGAMEIPNRVARIGWYDPDGLGVAPGQTGTAVLAGHVDSRSQGRGALFHLRDLRVGETIEVDLEDGAVQLWRITDIVQYPKDVLPLKDVFTWAGPPRLVLITCGGEFDRTVRSYTDNLVVYAEPSETLPTA